MDTANLGSEVPSLICAAPDEGSQFQDTSGDRERKCMVPGTFLFEDSRLGDIQRRLSKNDPDYKEVSIEFTLDPGGGEPLYIRIKDFWGKP